MTALDFNAQKRATGGGVHEGCSGVSYVRDSDIRTGGATCVTAGGESYVTTNLDLTTAREEPS